MKATINSRKHYVHQTNTAIASGARLSLPIVDSVLAPATATSASVTEGAEVKAVHCEYWLTGNEVSGNTTQFLLAVEKVPSGLVAMTAAQAVNLNSYQNKKNILYTTQGVLSSSIDGQSIPVIRDWVKIPKGKQRMGLGDKIIVTINAVGKLRACGLALYKEYQ